MRQFGCLEKTTDKCINCSVPIEKEIKAHNKKKWRNNWQKSNLKIIKKYHKKSLIAQDIYSAHFQILLIGINKSKCKDCAHEYIECIEGSCKFNGNSKIVNVVLYM